MKSKHLGLHAPWLVTAGVWAVACSLTVPSEDDVFGRYDANGGGEAGMPSGNGGGSDSGGKSGSGGKATSGTGAIDEAGAAGEPAQGGAPTGGTSPVGTAGSGGEPIVELPPAVLLVHYTFDSADVMNLIAKDSSGNGKDGTLTGTAPPAVEEGHLDGALRLDSTKNQHVQLPGDIMETLPAISVTSWVKLATGSTWDRLFDFSASESVWFYCSLTGWDPVKMSNAVRIAVAGAGHLDPELILSKPYPVGAWHHVAVVLAPPYLRYYQDGELLGEVTSMTVKPSDVGRTNKNWIGRSVHPTDPYLNGWVDDFRVYSGALTEAEVNELAAE
jgi:hypothetical protein